MKYRVIAPVGPYVVGQVVDDSDPYVRRKLREGDCLEPIRAKSLRGAPEDKSMPGAPANKSKEV